MTAKNQTSVSGKQSSTKSSTTGTLLSLFALTACGFGSILVHANFHAKQPLKTASEKISDAVGSTTGHVLASLIAVPFLVVGIALAIVSTIFIVRRLSKINVGGLIASLIWLAVNVWAFSLAVSAFQLLKAHS